MLCAIAGTAISARADSKDAKAWIDVRTVCIFPLAGRNLPQTRDELVRLQKPDGSWNSDGIGPVFDTAVGLIILQLPYKFLPIYQR